MTLKNTEPIVIGCIYRPEYHTDIFMEELEQTIELLQSELYLLGDFNCEMFTSKPKPITKWLLGLMKDSLLDQVINEPTRVTEKSKTAIDIIFTSHTERIIQKGVQHIGISDHSMAFIIRKAHIPKLSPKEITQNIDD